MSHDETKDELEPQEPARDTDDDGDDEVEAHLMKFEQISYD